MTDGESGAATGDPAAPEWAADLRRRIDGAEFVSLAQHNPSLDREVRLAFAESFARELSLAADRRIAAGTAFEVFVADGLLRTVFDGTERATSTWDGTAESVIEHAAAAGVDQAELYKEERHRYYDRRWD